MITTFIFDADGCIIDSEKLYDVANVEFLARRGYEFNRPDLKHLLTGKGIQNLLDRFREYYGSIPGNDLELIEEYREIVRAEFRKNIDYVPGFLEFYEKIKDKYKTGIATGSHTDLLDIADKRMAFYELFGGRVYSVHGLSLPGKPDPAVFLHAAEKLGSTPEECIVVEDAPAGLQAAKRAGMKSIGLAGTHDAEHLGEADIIVDSYEELDLDELNSI